MKGKTRDLHDKGLLAHCFQSHNRKNRANEKTMFFDSCAIVRDKSRSIRLNRKRVYIKIIRWSWKCNQPEFMAHHEHKIYSKGINNYYNVELARGRSK